MDRRSRPRAPMRRPTCSNSQRFVGELMGLPIQPLLFFL
jgi:hypothetical protein